MIGEVIAIGDELLSGRVLNTTSSFIASRLFASGHLITRITMVGDDLDAIRDALLSSLPRSQFVIITGGLGPTTDDITNEAVSLALGIPLVKNVKVEEQIRHMESRFGGSAPEQFKRKLTMLPKGADVLNPTGHAAGYELVYEGVHLYFLPGVPVQLEDHLLNRVLPMLNHLDGNRPFVMQEVLKLFGLSEVEINTRLEGIISGDTRVKIGYYPVFPEVHVSVTIIDDEMESARERLTGVVSDIHEEFRDHVVAKGEDGSLANTVGRLLEGQGLCLAAAESCTGGLLGATVTDVPGSSQWFDRSIVTYSNRAKEEHLGVSSATLGSFGAVSRQTAMEMVKGVRRVTGCDCAIAITGIAGPGGGSRGKPVGTVFIALSIGDEELVHRFFFPGSRKEIRLLTVETALDWLRRRLTGDSLLPGYRPVE